MTSWRDTDPRNICACGGYKSPESDRCRACHMRRVHRRRRLRKQAQAWIKRAMDGEEIGFRPGTGMSNGEFEQHLRDVLIA